MGLLESIPSLTRCQPLPWFLLQGAPALREIGDHPDVLCFFWLFLNTKLMFLFAVVKASAILALKPLIVRL